MPRRLDSRTTESRKQTNNMPLMPVNAAAIASVEPVAHGAVPRRIECCCSCKNHLLKQVMVLFERHPYFVRRSSRASGYRRPCSSRVWSASRVGTLPSFFQGWAPPLSQLDGASVLVLHLDRLIRFLFLILEFVCHAYPAFVFHPRFHQTP